MMPTGAAANAVEFEVVPCRFDESCTKSIVGFTGLHSARHRIASGKGSAREAIVLPQECQDYLHW